MFFISYGCEEYDFFLDVLIPLDQGCFLFDMKKIVNLTQHRLNPFGSGMFFIHNLSNVMQETLRS